jgi:2-iminobutanoate/2-iminopropanoate deaminase
MKSRVVNVVFPFLLGAAVVIAATMSAAPQTAGSKKPIYAGAKPLGPYTPGIDVGNLVFLSGQIGISPATGKLIEGGVEAEARQAMENLGGVLKEAGLGYENVVKTTIFLADIDDYGTVNKIYASFFTGDSPPPARSTLQVAAIPAGARIEIDFIAVR